MRIALRGVAARLAAKLLPVLQVPLVYAPRLDGPPAGGEIVKLWVIDPDVAGGRAEQQVLVLGRVGTDLVTLLLSNDERGEHWLELEPGEAAARDVPARVRLFPVVGIAANSVRRDGTVLDRERFDQVVAALRRDHGWQ